MAYANLPIKRFKFCTCAVRLKCARCVRWYQEATYRRGKHIVLAYFKVLSEYLRWMAITQNPGKKGEHKREKELVKGVNEVDKNVSLRRAEEESLRMLHLFV